MSNETKITCPNCGQEIDVNSVITHNLEEEFKKKYNAKWVEEKKKYQDELDKLEKQKQEIEILQQNQETLVAEKLATAMKSEKEKFEKQIKSQLQEEQSERIALIEKELQEKSEQVKDLNRAKAEIEQIKREKAELKEAIEAESAKLLNTKLNEERSAYEK